MDEYNVNFFAKGDVLLNTGSGIYTHGGNVNIGIKGYVDSSDPLTTNLLAEDFIPTSFKNNGEINTTGGTNQDSGTPVEGTSNIIIGNNLGGSRAFDGKIPSLKIYTGILSVEQISQEYSNTRRLYE